MDNMQTWISSAVVSSVIFGIYLFLRGMVWGVFMVRRWLKNRNVPETPIARRMLDEIQDPETRLNTQDSDEMRTPTMTVRFYWTDGRPEIGAISLITLSGIANGKTRLSTKDFRIVNAAAVSRYRKLKAAVLDRHLAYEDKAVADWMRPKA